MRTLRFWLQLTLVLTLSACGSVIVHEEKEASAPTARAGHWEGDLTVSFDVTAAGDVRNFKIKAPFGVLAGQTCTIEIDAIDVGDDAKFTVGEPEDAPFYVAAEFIDAIHLAGTFKIALCSDGEQYSVVLQPEEKRWSAAWVGSSTGSAGTAAPATEPPVPPATVEVATSTLPPSTPTPTPTPTSESFPTWTAAPPPPSPTELSLPVASWQPVLDLPRYINALVVDPVNPQIFYAATGNYAGSGSGVYKSEDAGLTWRSVTAGLPNEEVLALAFGSSDSPILYVLVGGDIFASADGAAGWSRLGDTGFLGGYERSLRADPSDGNVLFALSKSDSLVRSRDGGYAWQPIGEGLPDNGHGGVSVLSLALDPTDTSVVYAGTGAFVGGGQGVYKSADGGETWSPANRGMLDYRITALAVDPAHPQTIYAGADSGEFFKSTDGGQTWNDLTDELPTQKSSHPTIQDIVIDPATPGTVYLLADNAGVLISEDGGDRWRALGNPAAPDYASFTAMTIIFDLQPEPVLIVGIKDSGGWRYDVAQAAPPPTATEPPPTSAPTVPLPSGRWQPITDLPRDINTLVADPTDPQVFYASTGDLGSGGGVYKSTDGGQTWGAASSGLSNEAVLALAFSYDAPPTLYAVAGVSGEVFASVDGVANWTRLGNSGLWGGFYRRLYTAPGDEKVLFTVAHPGGVARSDDGGYTWLPFGEGLPQDESGEIYALSLAIDPTDANVIYLGTGGWVGQGYGVFKSTDGGETWSPANRGMLDYRISALAVDPTNPQTVYAGGDSGELFKSTDGGQSWQDLSENLRLYPYLNARTIRDIVINPAAPETVYLLGDVVGVMVSNDGGAKWRALAKPGEDDQPVFTAMAVTWEAQPVFVVGIENAGGWRYAAD